ncbi:MAG: tRNA (N6-threonylcarbamoyladenosine(37)-N6)-methyltransferase TrmO [Thermoplasmata archaeon]|nr:MAG: tRNA (N6-threonylcarbamoyladenosine(37)-N6)-methyltransferase TrmO [Thermoplasmata archaeon]
MIEIKYKPIGVIHSPFKTPQGTPIQPPAAKGVKGKVELFPQYIEGLKDLQGFSHIILIYHFHLTKNVLLKVKPFMDNKLRGVFATRAPTRPNPLGISVVRLLKIRKNILYIQDVDVVEGTPLLDIKPYVPDFDIRSVNKIGWLKRRKHKLKNMRDDGRFVKSDCS